MKTDCERNPNEVSVVGHEMDDEVVAEDPFAEFDVDHQPATDNGEDDSNDEEPFEIPAPNVILSDWIHWRSADRKIYEEMRTKKHLKVSNAEESE